jgi:arylsulfatase A-like enzyme
MASESAVEFPFNLKRGLRMINGILRFLLTALAITILAHSSLAESRLPNIVMIFADDLGYGDLQCYNPKSKIPTPHLNKLASEGMRFTDAHSPSTVCTPSRYSLLTGQMAFRAKHRDGQLIVFTGVGGPCLIEKGQLTLPSMLKQKGYSTALFGKWHIGMTFYNKNTGDVMTSSKRVLEVDYTRPIPDGPVSHGFDTFFGTACCPTTDWLYSYINNDTVTMPPKTPLTRTEKDRRGLTLNPWTHDFRPGWASDDFEPQNVDVVFLEKSIDFLKTHHAEKKEKPFYLQLCTQGVHLPSIPADAYKGSTEFGPHGDFIHQLDATVGKLMATLDELGYADNTLVLFSSDNGPEVPTVIHMVKEYNHQGASPWRGVKRDGWEGGHRVPFLARWPGTITPGSVSDQLTSLTDVMATCAAIVDVDLPNDSAVDSFNMLPALKGETKPIRSWQLQQSTRGKSIRKGKWKYMDHQGSGGNDYSREGDWGPRTIALDAKEVDAPAQLYNLEEDPQELNNLFHEHPELVQEMKAKLEELVDSGRSAPPGS